MSGFQVFVTYLIIIFGVINIVRMTLFMVGSDIYALNQVIRKKRKQEKEFPRFSVVIPGHNEENTVVHCVQSVLHSNYPKDRLQVIVVDDGSSDATVRVLKEFRASQKYFFTIVEQENAGKANALNNGMRNFAGGDLVMCLDADSTLHPDALANAAQYFADPRVVALSANVKIRPQKTLLNLIQRFEYLICYQMKRAQTVFNIEYIIGGIGSTFRHTTLAKVGYYDTNTITEDIDLTMKFIQLGNKEHRVIYGSDVIAFTESVLDIKGLIRQRYRWKFGRCQTFIKNLSLFFSSDRKNSKWLTWLYLPFAIFGDIAFFFEPLVVGYIAFIVLYYADWITFLGAFITIGTYTAMSILSEDTLPKNDKIRLIFLAPWMYFLFYVMSYVEYVALIKTYIQAHKIPESIRKESCGWQHVERAKIGT